MILYSKFYIRFAGVTQLARVPAFQADCCGFESRHPLHEKKLHSLELFFISKKNCSPRRTVSLISVFVLLLSKIFSECYCFWSWIIDIWIRSSSEWKIFWDIISFNLRQTLQYICLSIDRT